MTAALDTPPVSEYFEACPIGRIHPDPINPRTHVDVDDDFVASIAGGIHEPLIVRPDRDKPTLTEPEDFKIVAGERRYTGALAASLDAVPVLVRYDLDDDADAIEVMIVENGQRESLPPLDEARAYALLVEKGRTQRDIAAAVGREQGTVSKRLSLLKLPVRAQQLLDDGRITVKTALGMTGLTKDNGRLSKVLDYAAQNSWAEDADIARIVFTNLEDMKRIAERAKEAKKLEKKIAELRAGELEEKTEDDLDGNFEECDDDDPNVTVFVIRAMWNGDKYIEYYRPWVEGARADGDHDHDRKPDDNGEWEARRAREDAARKSRESLIANLCGDGYPGDDIAIPYILRMTLEDAFERDAQESIATLLNIVVPDDVEDELEAQRDAIRNYPDLTRAAFANALDFGSTAWVDDSKRLHLQMLRDNGYACDLPEERELFGDTIPDGDFENDDDEHGQPPLVEQTDDIATVETPDEETEPPAEPFKAYRALPIKSILRVIANPDTEADRLEAIVAYETANRGDATILDAAHARLDALAVAS